MKCPYCKQVMQIPRDNYSMKKDGLAILGMSILLAILILTLPLFPVVTVIRVWVIGALLVGLIYKTIFCLLFPRLKNSDTSQSQDRNRTVTQGDANENH